MKHVSHAMLGKLRQYSALIITPAAKFARVVDPRFRTDILCDAEILWDFVNLPDPTERIESAQSVLQTRSFINENSVDEIGDDEVIRFLRATNNGDKAVPPMVWWKGNAERFLHIAKEARRHLATQASSVARESVPSVSRNLIDADRSRLSDDSITSCMFVRAWERFFDTL